MRTTLSHTIETDTLHRQTSATRFALKTFPSFCEGHPRQGRTKSAKKKTHGRRTFSENNGQNYYWAATDHVRGLHLISRDWKEFSRLTILCLSFTYAFTTLRYTKRKLSRGPTCGNWFSAKDDYETGLAIQLTDVYIYRSPSWCAYVCAHKKITHTSTLIESEYSFARVACCWTPHPHTCRQVRARGA